MKKRIVVCLWIFVSLFLLVACGKTEENEIEENNASEEIVVEDASYEYDGEAHGLKIKGLKDGDRVEYSEDGKEYTEEEIRYTETGAYTVYYRIERDGEKIKSGSARIYISKRILEGISSEDKEVEYDGEEHGIDIKGIKETDRIKYSIDGETYEEKEITVADVGKYTVYYIVERGNGEYRDSCEIEIKAKKSTLIVDGKSVEITCRDKKEIKVKSKVLEYDGQEHGIEIETTGILCVRKGDGYTKDIPKYTEVGRYEEEYTVIEDGYLPIEVTGIVEIYESKNGIYYNDSAVIEITTDKAERNGNEIARDGIEKTNDGITYLGEKYKELTDGKIIEIRINGNSYVKPIEPNEYYLKQDADGIVIENCDGEIFFKYTPESEVKITDAKFCGRTLNYIESFGHMIAEDKFSGSSYVVLEIGIEVENI